MFWFSVLIAQPTANRITAILQDTLYDPSLNACVLSDTELALRN